MVYTNINNCAYINGSSGKYDGTIQNASVRYGRNAIANHLNYLSQYRHNPVECDTFEKITIPNANDDKTDNSDKYEELKSNLNSNINKLEAFINKLKEAADKMPPIAFELQYMPQANFKQIDTHALMGAAFEEMGQKSSISIYELDRKLNSHNPSIYTSIAGLDINGDKKITIGEYATSILFADGLSNDKQEFSIENIDGKITNKGEDALVGKYNADKIKYSIYPALYALYNLDKAEKDFIENPNNTTVNR